MSSKIEDLKQKLKKENEKKLLKQSRERKRRFDMRRKAQRSIVDLTSILTKIGNLDSSENDYAQIFRDDKPYFDMLEACNLAYSESYKSRVKLRQNPDEFLVAIQVCCMKVGLRVHSVKQLSNSRFQNKVFEELKKHPTEYQSFIEYYRQLASRKADKKIEELLKKGLQHVRDVDSTIIDLYGENRKKEDALQIASQIYGKLLEDDHEFMKKPLEQISKEFLNERDSKRPLSE